MMRRAIFIGTVLAGAAVWYLFRPERLFLDKTVHESFPAPAHSAMAGMAETPVMLGSGPFHTNAHKTNGQATIYRLPDGHRVLRLTTFATSNGPDVRVYLVAASDVLDDATVQRAGSVDLGAIKGNVGDQNYDVPADLDLRRYRAVTIWCRRFSVNFGTAPLTARAS